MTLNALRKILTAATACATLTVAAVGPAHATYVVGSWDPAYGMPFTNLGWRGTSTSDIPADCLALGNVGTVLNNGAACSLMSLVSARVEFYDLRDIGQTTVDTLDFSAAVAVSSIFLDTDTGALRGLGLRSLNSVLSTTPLARPGGTGVQAYFSLELVTLTSGNSLARLHWGPNSETGSGSNDEAQYPASVDVRVVPVPGVVPEPGSPALALAAFAALAAFSRFAPAVRRE